jgi:TonB family protein
MRRSTDPRPSLVLAFLTGAVVLLHGLLAGGAALVNRYGFGLAEPWEQARARDPLLLEELRQLRDDDYQVVEIDRPKVETKPRDAKFRSEWNSRVTHQTQARVKGLAPVAVASLDRLPPQTAVEPPPARVAPRPGVELRPSPAPSPLAMRQVPPTPAPGAAGEPAPRESPWKRKLSLRNLTPSNGTLQKVIPTAFPDYLKDIDYGDRTLLDTAEWKFASFFNRVKRAVAQHWHPDREYSRRDPNGNVYGFKTRMTILHVILHPNGTLKKIVLEKPSGLTFLDDEAIRAFRKAAPFPNPPHRLVSTRTGVIAFRFGFIFEVTRSPSWRILRLK